MSTVADPVVSACSESEADSGPLVITGALLVPRIVTVTVCVPGVENDALKVCDPASAAVNV